MQLLDDHMFRLWQQGIVEKSEILLKANMREALEQKIARAERGLLEDEEESRARMAKGGNGQDEPGAKKNRPTDARQ
jgi:twitching motility protein PilT